MMITPGTSVNIWMLTGAQNVILTNDFYVDDSGNNYVDDSNQYYIAGEPTQ